MVEYRSLLQTVMRISFVNLKHRNPPGGCKILILVVATAITLTARGQDSFQNLSFESTSLSQTDPAGLVSASVALPYWTAFDGSGNPLLQIGYKFQFAGTPIALLDSNGQFSVFLVGAGVSYPGGPLPFAPAASIAQTGMMPKTARYIFFKAKPGTSLLLLSLGGVNVPYTAVATKPDYTLFAGDVSSFAGQSLEMRFTVGYRGTGWILESIGFSKGQVMGAGLDRTN